MPMKSNQDQEMIHGKTPEFPTIKEQITYWQRKEQQQAQLLQAVNAFSEFLDALQKAMAKLREDFENLNKK